MGWWQGPELQSCITDSSRQIKATAFIGSVEVATNLILVFLVVARPCGIFDNLDMRMLGGICTPVDSWAICLNIRCDTLHKFQFGDVPILYRAVAFANTYLCIHDSLLMVMKVRKCSICLAAHDLIKLRSLGQVAKVHKRANRDDEVPRCSTGNDSNNIPLDITVLATCNLLEP